MKCMFKKKRILSNSDHLALLAESIIKSGRPCPVALANGKIINKPEWIAYRVGDNIWVKYTFDDSIYNHFYDTNNKISWCYISGELNLEDAISIMFVAKMLPSKNILPQKI